MKQWISRRDQNSYEQAQVKCVVWQDRDFMMSTVVQLKKQKNMLKY
jgi:hypothetical protein